MQYTTYTNENALYEIADQMFHGLVSVTEAAFKAFDLGYHIESISAGFIAFNRELKEDPEKLFMERVQVTQDKDSLTLIVTVAEDLDQVQVYKSLKYAA